jgi:ABC transporter DrrB family efflux protein
MTIQTIDPSTTVPSVSSAPVPAGAARPGGGGPGGARAGLVAPLRTAGPLTTALTVASRTTRRFVRTPQLLVTGTITGAMFLLIFRYVFGGAIGGTGSVPYVDLLVPGYVVTSVLFGGSDTAAGVAADAESGFDDRLRSLPVSRTAVVAGRVMADTAVLAFGLAVTTLIGVAVGFRLHGNPLEALGAYGLLIVFGASFTWLFTWLGLVAGSAQAAQGLSLMVFPLSFVSSAMVPVDSMPGWMQPVAENQPITVMVNAVRSLTLGDPALAGLDGSTARWVLLSLAWAAGITAVFVPLTVARFRRS